MNANSILNADMATVSGWLREGWRWWTQELADMVPASLQSMGRYNGPLALYRDDGRIEMLRSSAGSHERPKPADLAIAEQQCLIRDIELPTMSLRDVKSTVALEAGRLFPLSDGSLLIDAEISSRSDDRNNMQVRIAAIRRDHAESAIAVCHEAGIAPQRIGIQYAFAQDRLHFDFAPIVRAAGLLPARSSAPVMWWGLVGFLFALNIGLLVWRDQQSVDNLHAAVEAQAPAVSVYRTIAARTARIEQVARTTASRRAAQDVVGDLATVTTALPDSAWVQRYDWNGMSVRLAGYLRPPADINVALRKNSRFINVRMSSADVQTGIPIGQPYDITADIRRGGR